jgi:hypothetical protein
MIGDSDNAYPHKVFYVGAHGKREEEYGLAWVNGDSGVANDMHSGFRGHAMVQHPLRRNAIVMFGRRPATQGIEVDIVTGELRRVFTCAKNYHLFGHGCFSADGKTLMTTEANYETGEGKIVLRDAEYEL